MLQLDSRDSLSNRAANLSGIAAGVWGILGFSVLVGNALRGMSAEIEYILATPLTAWQTVGFVLIVLVFGLAKGYFIFRQRFCRSYASRIGELIRPPVKLLYAVLAPLYCLNMIGAERRQLVRGYALVAGIILMIISVKFVPFPWRGMILTGVAVALTWAALEIAYRGFKDLLSLNRTDRQ